jgi:hypothetical protein
MLNDRDIAGAKLVLLNALAIDMKWDVEFSEEDTRGREFIKDDGKKIEATTLFQSCTVDGKTDFNPFGYYFDDDIQVIDLTSDSDPVVQNEQFPSTPSVPEEPSIPETPNNPTEDPSTNPEAVNPLEAVEGLVGPINNNDLVAQEIMQYQELGASLKDQ